MDISQPDTTFRSFTSHFTQIFLHSFITVNLVSGTANFVLPSLLTTLTSSWPPTTVFRLQGICYLTFGALSLGLQRLLRGSIDLPSFFLLTLTFYIIVTLSSMLFAFSSRSKSVDLYGWLQLFFNIV
jgi:hypothetical protein